MLKSILVARATGTAMDARSETQYKALRNEVMSDGYLKDKLPRFVRTHRTLSEFWGFIKDQSPSYAGRREVLRREFEAVLAELEAASGATPVPADQVLIQLNSDLVNVAWARAVERVALDPEGAITAARSLLESVCKHILAQRNQEVDADALDLPQLYDSTAKELGLAPSQHTADAFKRILGGCTTVVHNLATLRNRLGDAHGKSPASVRPAPRHARLAVNLAGTMASFLVETFEDRNSRAVVI